MHDNKIKFLDLQIQIIDLSYIDELINLNLLLIVSVRY